MNSGPPPFIFIKELGTVFGAICSKYFSVWLFFSKMAYFRRETEALFIGLVTHPCCLWSILYIYYSHTIKTFCYYYKKVYKSILFCILHKQHGWVPSSMIYVCILCKRCGSPAGIDHAQASIACRNPSTQCTLIVSLYW